MFFNMDVICNFCPTLLSAEVFPDSWHSISLSGASKWLISPHSPPFLSVCLSQWSIFAPICPEMRLKTRAEVPRNINYILQCMSDSMTLLGNGITRTVLSIGFQCKYVHLSRLFAPILVSRQLVCTVISFSCNIN